jgi:hypothetical protein
MKIIILFKNICLTSSSMGFKNKNNLTKVLAFDPPYFDIPKT